MTQAFISGFLLSLSLILAIGAQNAFLLRQGLRGHHVFALALCCAVSDALLIAIGVAGFATFSAVVPQFAVVMRYLGAAFLIVYGALNLVSALRNKKSLNPTDEPAAPFWPTIMTGLALTWFNPHVYLDTIVLLGSVSSQYGQAAWVFGIGAIMASFIFFFSLGYGARFLRPFFARPLSWRILDIAIAIIMWTIAATLLASK